MLSGLATRQSGSATVSGLSGQQRLRLLSSSTRSRRHLSTSTLNRASQLHRAAPFAHGASPLGPSSLRNCTLQSQSVRSISLWPFGKKAPAEAQVQTPPEPAPATTTETAVASETTAGHAADAAKTTAASESVPSASASDIASSAPDAVAAPSYSGVDAIDSVTSSIPVDLTQLPEGLGYLKALGLDYGWGPSTIMEYVLETLHFTGGLPWWGSAIAASLLIRMILVKATVGASDTAAKLNLVKDITKPLNDKMIAAYNAGEQAEMMIHKRKIMKIHEKNGIKTWKAFLPMLQVPFGFGVFRVMRAMADLPVPGLEEESVMWLTDISVCDPYYVLPVATGAMMYFALKKGGDAGTANIANSDMAKYIRIGLPITTTLFMAWWPSILQLYFTTSGAWSLGQAYALQNGRLRSMMGIAPLPNRDAASTAEAKMYHLRTLAEQAKEAEEQPKESKIDQWVGQVKETTEGVTGMFKTKDKEPHERFTQSQLKEAREWEKKRAEEEDTERNSYNSRMKEEWEAMQRRKERQQQRLRRGASSSKKDSRDRH